MERQQLPEDATAEVALNSVDNIINEGLKEMHEGEKAQAQAQAHTQARLGLDATSVGSGKGAQQAAIEQTYGSPFTATDELLRSLQERRSSIESRIEEAEQMRKYWQDTCDDLYRAHNIIVNAQEGLSAPTPSNAVAGQPVGMRNY